MKKIVLFFYAIFLLNMMAYPQNQSNYSSQNNDFISNLMKLSYRQLYDTANYYFEQENTESSLICYHLLISKPIKNNDFEQQKIMVEATNKISVVYYFLCDYRSSYDFLIKALLLCEKYSYTSYLPKIYTNIGNIYYLFNKFDMARWYYSEALTLSQDSISKIILLSNLGAVELKSGNTERASDLINRSLQLSKWHNDCHLPGIKNNFASLYHQMQMYDSAYYYYRASLEVAKEDHQMVKVAENLSDLANLFFDMNKMDSALLYTELSSAIANEKGYLNILADNYLILSKIKEKKEKTKEAFELYKEYAHLKDSIYNVANFGDINQLQRLYEIGKTNHQIEQLHLEKEIKERTIYHQRIIWVATLCILLFVTNVLVIIFLQKRKLNKAYQTLFEKNIEIIDLQKKSSENYLEKQQKTALAGNMQEELLERILTIMSNTAIICDPAFTIDKLATMAQSNHTYVSQVINSELKKNFRSFLNSYRIREAQRLFSEPDAAKYTIEAVSLQVGFKSRSTFRDAFTEITGVSPRFYLKSIQGFATFTY